MIYLRYVCVLFIFTLVLSVNYIKHFAPVSNDLFQLNPSTLQNAIDKQKEVLVALQRLAVIVTTDKKSFNKSISKSQSFNRKSQIGWNFPAVYIGDGVYPGVANISGIWYSQVGQDKTIVEIFKGKMNGYFVDLASNDAVSLSNTLVLEQVYGWDGLCIDANLDYFRGLVHRRCQLLIGAAGRENNEIVNFALNGVYSGVVNTNHDNKESTKSDATLKTFSLEKAFEDMNVPLVIDYFSLDIEGAEYWVLERFPWNRYTFLTLTVERPKQLLVEMLRNNGYEYVKDHGNFGDQLWIHHYLPNFDEVMAKMLKSNT